MSDEQPSTESLLLEVKRYFRKKTTTQYIVVLSQYDGMFRVNTTVRRVQQVISGYRSPNDDDRKWLVRAAEIVRHIDSFKKSNSAIKSTTEEQHGS